MSTPIDRWLYAELERSRFLERYPLYAYVLARFEVMESLDVAVMAVSGREGRPLLHVNRSYFGVSSPYVAGVLLHEIHHVVLGHLSDPRYRTARSRQALIAAVEISANEDIREPLPGRPYRLEHFSELGIAAGQGTWQRYELLAESTIGEPLSDARTLLAVGGCGALVAEPTDGGTQPTGAVDAQAIAALLDTIRLHSPSSSSGEMRIAGRSPDQLIATLRDLSAVHCARLDWKALLRQFVRAPRADASSYARPNRRFRNRVGEIPGKRRGPGHRRRKLLAVVDTSGSVSDATLGEIFSELTRLRDLAEVVVVECDERIRRVYPIAEHGGTVQGRGGTDLRPPFDRTFLRRHAPSAIVYFTDGDGPYPDGPPSVPTLWVLPEGASFSCRWGHLIQRPPLPRALGISAIAQALPAVRQVGFPGS